MSKGKLPIWIKDNLVLLVGIPLIVGVHWGWALLQDNPNLVPTTKKRELPIVAAFKYIKDSTLKKFRSLTGNSESITEKPEH